MQKRPRKLFSGDRDGGAEPGVSGAPYRERPSVLGIRTISVIG